MIRQITLTAVLLHVALSTPLAAQAKPIAPEARKHLEQFLDLLQNRSIYRQSVDWKSLRANTMAAAESAQTIADTYPAIRVALTQLGDRHAYYRLETGKTTAIRGDVARCSAPRVTASPTMPANVGYVRVVPVRASDIRAMTDAVIALRALIKAGDDAGATSWIVDLRGLGYGGTPAMLLGLAPLMGDDVVLTNIDSNEGKTPFVASSQFIGVNEGRVQISDRLILKHRIPNVAVLIDGATGGSGEMLAAALTGRTEARLFGTPTCGLSPFVGKPLKLKNGAELVMSNTTISDRAGKRYPGPIEPDERVDDAAVIIDRALAWLTSGK